MVIAIPITLLLLKFKWLSSVSLALLGALYTIPSLAMFALLIPALGIGIQTAIVVLVIYNQYILVRNMFVAFESLDPLIIEAGKGMGLNNIQLFTTIQFPLALPIILGGIRISVISTIAIATIASVVNAGGIGVILFDGLRMNYLIKILWGVIMSAGLALIFNNILLLLEKITFQKTIGK